MFHELLTIILSFEQFTDFNGVFSHFSTKNLFLCSRETSTHVQVHDIHFDGCCAADVI